MDRRTLLAIVLSTAVVLLFNVFFLPRPEPPASRPAADSLGARGEMTAAEQALIGGAGAPDSAAFSPADSTESWDRDTEERLLRVETPLYRAVFSNLGARLVSWELLSFRAPDGRPVQLVSGSGELGLRLLDPAASVDLRSVLFSAREETLPGGGRRIVFEAGSGTSPRVTKVLTLAPDSYVMDMAVRLDGTGSGAGYEVGWAGGIPPSERNLSQYEASAGTIVLLGKNRETVHARSFRKEHAKPIEGNVRWAGARSKYFMAVVVPPPESSSRVTAVGDAARQAFGAWISMPSSGGSAGHDFHVYLGPMDYEGLKRAGHDLEKAVDLGWRVFEPLSKLLLWSMEGMYRVIPNYGVVIILLSVLTKLVFYPLTRSSVKSMRAMQKLQPELTALREKYKNDSQRMNTEMMALYKKSGVNPLGGCLPILVQMPVFIALYKVLSDAIGMRQAEFIWWINDLSSPDTIAAIGGFSIHVLPILLFGVTVLQQMWTPTGDSRQKMMGYMMPIITLFIFYSFPAGLNLYWTVNSIMTAAQQWQIHRADPMPARAKS